jgi:hypothetical protein
MIDSMVWMMNKEVRFLASEHEAVAKLRRFKDEVEDLLAAVEAGKDRQQLRATLKDLKERMKAEYKRCDTKRTQKDMDRIERDFYCPAIHKAWVAIKRAHVGATPSTWHDALYDACYELNYYLEQLEEHTT